MFSGRGTVSKRGGYPTATIRLPKRTPGTVIGVPRFVLPITTSGDGLAAYHGNVSERQGRDTLTGVCVCDVKMASKKDEATRSDFMAIYAPWPQGITYRQQYTGGLSAYFGASFLYQCA